jgi:hypothetical protein
MAPDLFNPDCHVRYSTVRGQLRCKLWYFNRPSNSVGQIGFQPDTLISCRGPQKLGVRQLVDIFLLEHFPAAR